MTLAQTTGLFAGRGEATHFSVLVGRLADPVDAGIAGDGLVARIDADDLKELVGGVLVDPVAVEDTQVSAATAHTLFGHRL